MPVKDTFNLIMKGLKKSDKVDETTKLPYNTMMKLLKSRYGISHVKSQRVAKFANEFNIPFINAIKEYNKLQAEAKEIQSMFQKNDKPIFFDSAMQMAKVGRQNMIKSQKKEEIKQKMKTPFDDLINDIKKKNTSINAKVYKTDKKADKVLNIKTKQQLKNMKLKKKNTSYYTCNIIIYQKVEEDEITEIKKTIKNVRTIRFEGKMYKQLTGLMHLNIESKDILNFKNKSTYRLKRTEPNKYITNHDFGKLVKVLGNDIQFAQFYDERKYYIDMISVQNNIRAINFNLEKVKSQKPTNIELFNSYDNNMIAHRYIDYTVNQNATSFKELFKQTDSNQYVLDNAYANSCFLNLIVDVFKPSFDKAVQSKVLKQTLTYKYLLELLNYKNVNATQDIGLTIDQSILFFEKFKLSLVCMNIYGKIFYEYRPEKQNKNIFPGVLYMLVYNKHTFKLNKDINSFAQTYEFDSEFENTIDKELFVSNETMIHKAPDDRFDVTYMVSTLDDIVQIINKYVAEQPEKMTLCEMAEHMRDITFIYDKESLDDLLFDMVVNHKYTPYISHNKRINSIRFRVGAIINCNIISNDVSEGDTVLYQIDSIEHYNKYVKINHEFYDSIMNSRHLSRFHDDTIKILDTHPINPIVGKFNQLSDGFYDTVDMNKAYTDNLMQMQQIPVYTIFDVWTIYDNHDVEDYTQYLVYCKDSSIESKILFNKKYNRVYGSVLKQIDVDYTILYYWRPSKLVPFNGKAVVDKLYSHDIDKSMKKFIVNNNLGIAEKKYNKKAISKVFQDINEAVYYQCHYKQSNIYSFGSDASDEVSNTVYDETKCRDLDNECEHQTNDVSERTITKCNSQSTKQLYILDVKDQKRLINGFTPIKDFIYSYQRLKLYNLYRLLESKNVPMFGIKTDCILVNTDKHELISRGIQFNDEIGGYKFEHEKAIIGDVINRSVNEIGEITTYRVNDIEIKDEFNTEDLSTQLNENNKTAVFGLYPGVGKTTSIKNLAGNTLFITPFNKLCQQLQKDGKEAITLHTLLGIDVEGKQRGGKKIENYNTICFDEILLYETSLLQRIYYFMQEYPQTKFYCTGDLDQLEPINNDLNNIPNSKQYLEKCINMMFPNKILLKINKRLKTEADRQKLVHLKNDIFDSNKDIIQTFKNHGFNMISDLANVTSSKNIAYFNYRRSKINNHVLMNVVDQPAETFQLGNMTLWKGCEILSNGYYKVDNKTKLYRNYSYNFDSMDDKHFYIIEPVTQTKIKLSLKDDSSRIVLPFATTCHANQGLSINEPITIFDCNIPYVSRSFIWTALTRATDFANVTIFCHPKSEVIVSTHSKFKQYFKFKVDSYKSQDENAKRTYVNSDYVSSSWIMDQLELSMTCSMCQEPYQLEVDDSKVKSNVTVDRINTCISHIKSNCRLLCLHCNCAYTKFNKPIEIKQQVKPKPKPKTTPKPVIKKGVVPVVKECGNILCF